MGKGWIGVDFDGTLVEYHGYNGGHFGNLIPAMADKVRKALASGIEIKILTARADDPYEARRVQDYLLLFGFPRLAVTNKKDYAMIELWDDRAKTVVPNTGEFEADMLRKEIDELKDKIKLLEGSIALSKLTQENVNASS